MDIDPTDTWQSERDRRRGITGAPAIEVSHISKRFRRFQDRKTNLKEIFLSRRKTGAADDFVALDDVSFDIPRGTTFGLIGHNGSGKSTLLKLIAGIHRPSSGSIVPHGRISAMLELGAGFHPELTGRENIYLNGSILGMPRKQIDAAIDEIIRFSGLQEFIDTPVKVYSSGMYVRLGFAIAVNLDPEILIIDEVIAVGDEEFQRKCFDHLHELRRKGVTIVLVSHSLGLVQTLCDQVAWLDHGKLRAVGEAGPITQMYLKEVNEAEAEAETESHHNDREVSAADRPGTKEIEITRLEFVGPKNTSRSRAIAGEPLRIRYHFAVHEPVTDPVFGIGIYTDGDVYVMGFHNRLQGVELGELDGGGYIDFVFDKLPLHPGTYMISAAITDWSLSHQYDLWDHGFELQVRPGGSSEYHGIVTLPGAWSDVVPTSDSPRLEPAPPEDPEADR